MGIDRIDGDTRSNSGILLMRRLMRGWWGKVLVGVDQWNNRYPRSVWVEWSWRTFSVDLKIGNLHVWAMRLP